MIKTY